MTPTTATPSPSVVLESGLLLETRVASIQAPAGFEIVTGTTSALQYTADPLSATSVSLGDTPTFDTATLREQAQVTVEFGGYVPSPRYLPNTVLDGVPVYHVKGGIGASRTLEEWGAIHRNRLITFTITYDNTAWSKARRRALYDVVVPTITFK